MNNILLIFNMLISDLSPEYIINFLSKLNLLAINSFISDYYGKNTNNSTIVFLSFFNLIYRFAIIDLESYKHLIKKSSKNFNAASNIIKSFFINSLENLDNLRYFKEQKKFNIEVHEIILRIASIISRFSKAAIILLKSNLVVDMLEFLKFTNKRKNILKEYEVKILNKKNNDNQNDKIYVGLLYTSIVEHTITILINILFTVNEIKNSTVKKDLQKLISTHVNLK